MSCAARRRPRSARWWSPPTRRTSPRLWIKPAAARCMTRADHASGSDRIFEALGKADPQRQRQDHRQSARRSADAVARHDRGGAGAARRRGRRYRDARGRDQSGRRSAAIPMSSRWWARRSRRRGCARFISPAPPRRPATGRSIITSASMPSAARRWSVSSRCRRRRSSAARSSSNCARSKPACASTSASSTPCRSASIRREDLEKARAVLTGRS